MNMEYHNIHHVVGTQSKLDSPWLCSGACPGGELLETTPPPINSEKFGEISLFCNHLDPAS